MPNILSTTLAALDIKHSMCYSSRLYREHPDNDNLYGIASMLQEYGVTAKGFLLDDITRILTLDIPFIVQIENRFAVVIRVEEDSVTYRFEDEKRFRKMGRTLFLERCSGIVMTLETNGYAEEPLYKEHRYEDWRSFIKKGILCLAVGIILILGYAQNRTFLDARGLLYLLLNVLGLSTCWLLIRAKSNKSDAAFNRICKTFDKKGCEGVLDSKYAVFVGGIHWSETGLGYFLANLVLFTSEKFIPIVILGNMLLLPFTLVSIWLQKYKLRRWCTFCLIVMADLWIMAGIGLLFRPFMTGSGCIPFLQVLSIYIIAVLCVHYIVAFLSKAKTLIMQTRTLSRFKTNKAVFWALLQEERHIDISDRDTHIVFGNPGAKDCVTIFSNPHCDPCAKLHKKLSPIIYKRPDIRWQFVFTSFSKSMLLSNQYLISTYYTHRDQALAVFDTWFESERYEPKSVLKKDAAGKPDAIVIQEIQAHLAWAHRNRLDRTPLVLVNGYMLPSGYSETDLEQIL